MSPWQATLWGIKMKRRIIALLITQSLYVLLYVNKWLCICSNNERWISNQHPVSWPSYLINSIVFIAITRGGYPVSRPSDLINSCAFVAIVEVDIKPASGLTAIVFNKQLCICSNNERWIANRHLFSWPSDLINSCAFVAIMRGGYQTGVRSHSRQI